MCQTFIDIYSVNNILTVQQSIVTVVLKIESVNELILQPNLYMFWAISLDRIGIVVLGNFIEPDWYRFPIEQADLIRF